MFKLTSNSSFATDVENNICHQMKCDASMRYVYPGGVYKSASSVFDDLKLVGFDMNPEERCEVWFACFDFEAYRHNFQEGVDEVNDIEEGAVWGKIHKPVSLSVGSNLEDVETVHVPSKDPGDLLSEFVDVLLEMADKKYEISVAKFEDVFKGLRQAIKEEKERIEEDHVNDDYYLDELMDGEVQVDGDGNVESEYLKKLIKMYGWWEGYCKELPVFGFNSSGYHLKLVQQYLMKELCTGGEEPCFTVKKAGKHPCIKTESLKFLEILN